MSILLGALSSILGLATKAISATIVIQLHMLVAYYFLVWFTLSLISGTITCIDFMMGQPLVTWLITGKVQDLKNVNYIIGVSFIYSPFMIYIGSAVSITMLLWFFYLAGSLVFSGKNTADLSLLDRFKYFIHIALAVVWIPVLYFIAILGINGLIMVSEHILHLKKPVTSKSPLSKEEKIKIAKFIKEKLNNQSFIDNLNKLKPIDTKSADYQDILNSISSSDTRVQFTEFTRFWNSSFGARGFNTNIGRSHWIDFTNSIINGNKANGGSVTPVEIQTTLLKIPLLNDNYNHMVATLTSLDKANSTKNIEALNKLVGTTTEVNDAFKSIDTVFSTNGISINGHLFNIADFIDSVTWTGDNGVLSKQIPNLLYQIIMGDSNREFHAGWDNWSNLGMPKEFVPIIGLTHIRNSIKILGFGVVVNGMVLPVFVSIFLYMLSRAGFIIFWPFFALFSLIKTPSDGGELFRKYFHQLGIKFLQIIILACLWNLTNYWIIQIFSAIKSSNWYTKTLKPWQRDVAGILFFAGLYISSMTAIRTFLFEFEAERDGASKSLREITKTANRASGGSKNAVRGAHGTSSGHARAVRMKSNKIGASKMAKTKAPVGGK